jgi:putative spermidine/putrescine transport system permease protein
VTTTLPETGFTDLEPDIPPAAPPPPPRNRRRTGLLLAAPSVVLLIAVFVTAMETMVEYSFQVERSNGANKIGTIETWRRFLGDGYYWSVIRQTVVLGLITTAITAVAGYLTAYALFHIKRRPWRNIGLGVVFSPFVFSGIASVYAWQLLLGQSGFLNSTLSHVGIGPLNLLYQRTGVVLALVQALLPLMVLPILSSLNQIDGSLGEAANDLGASPWRTFVRVTLPMSAPGLIAGCQLTFALTISAFTAPSLLGGGRVVTLSTSVYSFVQNSEFPMASVAGLLLLVLALLSAGVFLVLQRRFADADRGGRTFAAARPRGIKALGVWMAVVFAFELIPAVIVVISSFSSVSWGAWPPPGYSLHWYHNLFAQQEAWPSFWRSIEVGVAVVVLALLLGVLASIALVRFRFRGATLIQSALMSPLVVPKIAFGFAAFMLLFRLNIGSGRWAVVLAHTVATVPIVLVLTTAALLRTDQMLDQAAIDLGASAPRAFLKSTLPQITPAIVISGVVCFLVSFNEVELSIFMLNGKQQTLPVWMFNYLNDYQDPTPAALSTLMGGFALVLVLIVGLLLFRSQAARRMYVKKPAQNILDAVEAPA